MHPFNSVVFVCVDDVRIFIYLFISRSCTLRAVARDGVVFGNELCNDLLFNFNSSIRSECATEISYFSFIFFLFARLNGSQNYIFSNWNFFSCFFSSSSFFLFGVDTARNSFQHTVSQPFHMASQRVEAFDARENQLIFCLFNFETETERRTASCDCQCVCRVSQSVSVFLHLIYLPIAKVDPVLVHFRSFRREDGK